MRDRTAPWDGVGCVVVVRRRELAELGPEFTGQVFLVEGEPAVGYGWAECGDPVLFVLVLFMIYDAVVEAVAVFHYAETHHPLI